MNVVVVGGGPAGLRAAEVLASSGAKVTLYDGNPSMGRKFLVAGHGGLNLTHSEPLETFGTRYKGGWSEEFWNSLLLDFGNQDLRKWAQDLGIETFIGTSGRIFPKEFKAAPLLRSWVQRIKRSGVTIRTRTILKGLTHHDDHFHLLFTNPQRDEHISSQAVVLALGGASWPKTGSNASWVPMLTSQGVLFTPFQPANCGWEIPWDPDTLPLIEGQPLKNITIRAGGKTIAGELLITGYGLEGGALYQLGNILRSVEKPTISLDLKPTFSKEELASKMTYSRNDSLELYEKTWRLSPVASILFRKEASAIWEKTPAVLAGLVKNLPLRLLGPRPITEAISSAGGVSCGELDEYLMIKRLPGLFVAGEMIDWEAPTGGYLLQGCFSTGTRAAKGAVRFLREQASGS